MIWLSNGKISAKWKKKITLNEWNSNNDYIFLQAQYNYLLKSVRLGKKKQNGHDVCFFIHPK